MAAVKIHPHKDAKMKRWAMAIYAENYQTSRGRGAQKILLVFPDLKPGKISAKIILDPKKLIIA